MVESGLAAAETTSRATANSAAPLSRGQQLLRPGDTISLVFYESLGSDDEKWSGPAGQQTMVPKSFFQRPELTAKYQVGLDGTISVPMLGRFNVADLSTKAVEDMLAEPYRALVQRKTFVSVTGVARQPIYVAGPVKQPGSFEYREGMTVIQAVALAGGVDAVELQPWQRVEMQRQAERLRSSLDELQRLIARSDVMKTEGLVYRPNGVQVADLSPGGDWTRYFREERWARQLTGMALTERQKELDERISEAKANLELRRTRVGNYDRNIETRRKRYESFQRLARNKLIGSADFARIESELADVEDRKQMALIDVQAAEQNLSVAYREREKSNVDRQVELDRGIVEVNLGLAKALQSSGSDLSVFEALLKGEGGGTGAVDYRIIRRVNGKVVSMDAVDMSVLEPGDVVKVSDGP